MNKCSLQQTKIRYLNYRMGHSQKMSRFHISHSWKWRETLRHIL